MEVPAKVTEALEVARRARENAHAPYSRFKVGASVKLRDHDEPIGACNVENASFGATVCAERNAVAGAVARYGRIDPEFVLVVTGASTPTPPCALCLQVLAEFCRDDLQIYLAGPGGVAEVHRLGTLLPRAFRSFVPEPEATGRSSR